MDKDTLSFIDMARQLQRARARTSALFPRDVFRDSAWEMMLELFVAEEMDRALCVKELILASGETATSALRRIDRLEDNDMLARCIDPGDHRRVMVSLTHKGSSAMRAMLRNVFLDDMGVREPAAAPRSLAN